jgi:hypothetical protein
MLEDSFAEMEVTQSSTLIDRLVALTVRLDLPSV